MNARQCPTLNELPLSPPGKTGWPWTVESPQLPDSISFGSPWPRISIVTPSYNQGEFIEETIRSVLLQGYPNFEYIIMDGGSKDASVEILRKYEPWLTYWVSEKDAGQADAIFRGFERATGEIVAWVNSDDVLLPNALIEFGKFFDEQKTADLVVGGCVLIDEKSEVIKGSRGFPNFNLGAKLTFTKLLWIGAIFNQPATMWRRKAFFDAGGFDQSLHFCFDFDLFLRLTKKSPSCRLKKLVAAFRLHNSSKTSTQQDICLQENQVLFKRYGRLSGPEWLVIIIEFYHRKMRLLKWRMDMMPYLLVTTRWPFKNGRLF